MNSRILRQYDAPWGRKPYPGRGYTVGGAGCGLLACTHIAIEQESKKNWTPENLRTWMIKKGFVTYGNGTRWEGITETLKHIGHEKVVRIYNDPMKVAFEELNKGNRIGIILFGDSRGPDRTVWTTSGHYIAFTSYKYQNGQHMFYLKDSGGRKHDGWYSYEKSMRGDVRKMWIVERVGKQATPSKAVTKDGKLIVDGIGGIATVKKMQKFFGVEDDGVISSQNKNLKQYYPAFKSVSFDDDPKGSAVVKMMQKWLGISPDGILGKTSVKALQEVLGVKVDGKFGKASMKAWQKYLNEHERPPVLPNPKKEPKKEEKKSDISKKPKKEPKKEEKSNISKKPEVKKEKAWWEKANEWAIKIAKLDYHYVLYSLGKLAHECPWCHKHPKGKFHGTNCIGFWAAILHHGGGLDINCSPGVINNATWEKMLRVTPAEASKIASNKLGAKFKVIHHNGKVIPVSELKPGDGICLYNGKKALHIIYYMGNKRYADCGRGHTPNIQAGAVLSSAVKSKIKLVVRYEGK